MKNFILSTLLISTLITGYALIVFANSSVAQDFDYPKQTLSPNEVQIETPNFISSAEPTPKSSPSSTPILVPSSSHEPSSATNTTKKTAPADSPKPTPIPSPPLSPLPTANATQTPKPTASSSPTPTASQTPNSISTPNSPKAAAKISGYVTDSSGHGLAGALFTVMNIGQAGTDSSGYYSISVAPGTYHLNVWPPWDSNFIDHDDPEFVVGSSDLTKNVTLNVGFKVSGYVSTSSGETVLRAVVVMGSNYLAGWGSNSSGYYFVSVPAGTYTLWAHPMFSSTSATNFIHYYEYNITVYSDLAKNITVQTSGQNPTPTPTPGPTPTQLLFSVQSNSTITDLSFNATTFTLSFEVSGPSGTTGYTQVLTSKDMCPTFTGISASIDGKQLNFAVSSSDKNWIVDFSYLHSTHYVVVNIPRNA